MDSKNLRGAVNKRLVRRVDRSVAANSDRGASGAATVGKDTARILREATQNDKLISQYGKDASRSRGFMTDRSDAQPSSPRAKGRVSKPRGGK
jgi:hypothetical protein